MILSRDFEGGLDRFTAARREKDFVERPRREVRDFFGELDGGQRSKAERVHKFEFLILRPRRVNQFLPMVPDRARFHRADAVEIPFAIYILYAHAFAFDQ